MRTEKKIQRKKSIFIYMHFTIFGTIEFELRIPPSSEVQKSKNTL